MTTQDKLEKINAVQDELREMYYAGDFGELLRSGISQDMIDFLLQLKDYYRAIDQKKIIDGPFVI
ncbi:MAG: hypothetical protein LBT37_04400 [Lactobacillaceae bacterium]|jgi:hypothetical protein|nr:hypothetical protein [Lactobacillaceae bacterium]